MSTWKEYDKGTTLENGKYFCTFEDKEGYRDCGYGIYKDGGWINGDVIAFKVGEEEPYMDDVLTLIECLNEAIQMDGSELWIKRAEAKRIKRILMEHYGLKEND